MDIQSHARYVGQEFRGEQKILPNFFYFTLVYVFSFFSTEYTNLLYSSLFVVTLAITAKYFISSKFFLSFASSDGIKIDEGYRVQLGIGLIGFAMLFLFAIPWSYPLTEVYFYYRGKIPPNIWHNSTSIAVLPVALLLFITSYKTIEDRSKKNLLLTSFLVVLNVAIKPSFFFVYISVFPLFLLFKEKGFTKNLFIKMIPGAIGVVYMLVQIYIIYVISIEFGDRNTGKSGLAVAPFAHWASMISPKLIPLSIISSALLPIVFYLFYYKEILKGINLYAITTFIVSLLIFVLFKETGPRENVGNFFWQSFIGCYILFMVVIANIIKKYLSGAFSNGIDRYKLMVLIGVFFLHFSSGILYLYRIFHFGTYY